MTEPDGVQPEPPDTSMGTMVRVAVWGGVTTAAAYQLSGGSIGWFVAWMVLIGVTTRLIAYAVSVRRGRTPPPYWWA